MKTKRIPLGYFKYAVSRATGTVRDYLCEVIGAEGRMFKICENRFEATSTARMFIHTCKGRLFNHESAKTLGFSYSEMN